MWSIIVTCAFACCGPAADANTPAPAEELLCDLRPKLQTGSLVFSQGDCLAVKVFSQSSYTHVGGVVVKDGEAVVYDCMNGVGVRKTPFAEYLRLQTPSAIHIIHPNESFTPEKGVAFEQHLESQIGRQYAVKHHLTGRRGAGLHCSEYLTDALMAADIVSAKQPSKVSPGSLLEGVTFAQLYSEGDHFELNKAEPPPSPELSLYQRVWHNTSTGCSRGAVQVRRWILCR